MDTVAFGIFSCRRRRVAGARGALPSEHMAMLERSASSNPGSAMRSWAMAGTMKTARGLYSSTADSHRLELKRGWYRQRIPIFMGL